MKSMACNLKMEKLIERQGRMSTFGYCGQQPTYMIAPQKLWVFHQCVLRQLFMKQVVHVKLQALPQLDNNTLDVTNCIV